jgi:hypothetical protein
VKSGMNELKRLVLDYRTGELGVRCLYRSEDGPGPMGQAHHKRQLPPRGIIGKEQGSGRARRA